jgi:hypothetical protein
MERESGLTPVATTATFRQFLAQIDYYPASASASASAPLLALLCFVLRVFFFAVP